MKDNVNHPRHYRAKFPVRPIECIDITRYLPFSRGNAFKYIWRAGDKGGKKKAVEDCNKALWYLEDAEFNRISCEHSAIALRNFELLELQDTAQFQALWGIVTANYKYAKSMISSLIREFEEEKVGEDFHTGYL